jgi:hypothetical protein
VFAASPKELSFNPKPWPYDAAVTAGWAAAGWVERGAFEDEVAPSAPRGCDDQALTASADAALDVMKIFLEDLDRQPELSSEIAKLPLVLAQPIDDLLTAGPHERPG